MTDRVNALISLLFDTTATISEQDDAAMYLSEFPEANVVTALIAKSRDLNEDKIILNSCGESLGSIWVQQNIFDQEIFHSLSRTARHGVYFVVKSIKPEWVKLYNLDAERFWTEKKEVQ